MSTHPVNITLSPDLATVLIECETSDKFLELFVKHGLQTQQDVGLLVSSEAAFETRQFCSRKSGQCDHRRNRRYRISQESVARLKLDIIETDFVPVKLPSLSKT